jgi:hypothetical protein
MLVRMRVGQFNRSTIRAVGYLWSKRGQWLNMRQVTVNKSGEMNVQKKVGMNRENTQRKRKGGGRWRSRGAICLKNSSSSTADG